MTETTGVLDQIMSVFMRVVEWITSAVQSVIPMFYVEGEGLTFIGVLSVISLAIGIAFLLIGVITNFIKFRS